MSTSQADLKKLIVAGATEQVALLKPDTPTETIARTLVAMANCSGGHLIVGVDGEQIIGITKNEPVSDYIIDIALSLNPPLIISLPTVVELDKTSVVVAEIPRGLPHVYAYQGHYVQRDETSNIPIQPKDLRRLMMKRGEFSFETEVAHNSNLDDIDWVQAEIYANQLTGTGKTTVQNILYQRGCLAKQDNNLIPTYAGILLFGKSPQQFIRGSEITAVRFAGDTMSDTFNRQDITGTLPEQIRRAETFLVDHLRKSVTLKETMKRNEDYEYPMEAVRELIVNAVAHRDYSIQGDNIRLFMYSDHMEIHSPGSLPGPMTVENLKEERFSRNPIIVQILSDMGFIERLGYGVDRVIELMRSQGYKTPAFRNTDSGFKVTLNNQRDIAGTKDKSTTESHEGTILHFNGSYGGEQINPRQESALVYLHKKTNSRITNSDLKSMFPDVHPETIRRDLVDLVNKNILKKMGQKRGSYYILVDTNGS